MAHIPAVNFEMVRNPKPFIWNSLHRGREEFSMSIEQCVQLINAHIRADVRNQIMLCTDLRDEDVQAIRDMAAGRATWKARLLLSKMAQDPLMI
ncbi:hypothetical protein B0H10DRAFT_1370330 [Mycena sp. CBHHK59/15]|nr:hypothetical protein B0H10DRAFT_1370330 [Mycena sp. CBHHK59/15]